MVYREAALFNPPPLSAPAPAPAPKKNYAGARLATNGANSPSIFANPVYWIVLIAVIVAMYFGWKHFSKSSFGNDYGYDLNYF